MNRIIASSAALDGFLENKEFAGEQRDQVLKPALDRGERISIDFDGVDDVSQSFIHALIAEAIRIHGAPSLDLIQFKNASDPVRDAIQMVIRYTLSGSSEELRGA
jgi:hypothetical protein